MRLLISSILIFLIAIIIANNQYMLQRLTATPLRLARTYYKRTAMDTTKQFAGMPAVPPSDPSLNTATDSATPRRIQKAFLANEQSEGVGAAVRRSIGVPQLKNFSPFLMLDHFTIAPSAGFPDHPHRGQETITYMLSGAVDHEDFAGNKGTIWEGDLQFMTAGHGIVHAEMPKQLEPDPETGIVPPITGMQLWVDLPKKLKACEPRYRDLRASEIPKVSLDDGKVEVKIISGQSHGVDSVKELAYTPVWLLDVRMQPGSKISQNLPAGWNAFAYTLTGDTQFGAGDDATTIAQYHNVVFEQAGDTVVAEVAADAKNESRFILVAGLPLDQPIIQYGPFVVSTKDEVYQAVLDYQTNTNGFERALNWQSEIGKAMAN